MRRLLFAALIASAAACGPTRQWVSLEVDWTFGGHDCATAGVATIQVDIDGEVLTPNQFTCTEANQGASLGQFITGPYNLTVTGYDSANNLVFQSTRTIQVLPGRDNVIQFDAAPTTGDTAITWTFGGQTCAAAGVATVNVSLDDQVITDANNNPNLPCHSSGADGTTIGPLSPGSHTLQLAARGNSGDYAAGPINFTVTVGQVTPQQIDLAAAQPTTASADVRWNFQPGGGTCATVGADHLYIYFDPAGDGSGGTQVADTPCIGVGNAPVTELQIVDVPNGNHSFAVRATRGNTLIAYTHHPVTTLFTAPFTTAVNLTVEPTP